ncbi:hypothetical protein NX059_001615 [Plenodomus lindquistii]|nr:hypothetical protein NX059_001615 [Plenodomus lindquistii]
MRQYLVKHDATSTLMMEALDYRALDGLVSLPVKYYQTDVLDAYDEASNIVYEEMTRAQARWLSVELLNRGLVAERCVPTIVISSSMADEEVWWRVILPAMRLKLAGLSAVFDVEVLYCSTLFL